MSNANRLSVAPLEGFDCVPVCDATYNFGKRQKNGEARSLVPRCHKC